MVDDIQYLRDVQVLLLNDAGYAATALGNAREAFDRLGELAPELILLDMSMPGMDGRQFLRRLRATPEWSHLPVILTTGRFRKTSRATAPATSSPSRSPRPRCSTSWDGCSPLN